jgi:hypothetical protein
MVFWVAFPHSATSGVEALSNNRFPKRDSGEFVEKRRRSSLRLLNQRRLVADENGLHFLDVSHFRNGATLGNIAVSIVFSKSLAQVCDFEMAFTQFPNLSLGQHWRTTIPS